MEEAVADAFLQCRFVMVTMEDHFFGEGAESRSSQVEEDIRYF